MVMQHYKVELGCAKLYTVLLPVYFKSIKHIIQLLYFMQKKLTFYLDVFKRDTKAEGNELKEAFSSFKSDLYNRFKYLK